MESNQFNIEQKKKLFISILIAFIFFLSFIFFFPRDRETSFFTNPYLYIITPFKNLYNDASNYFSMLLNKYVFLTEVFEENIRLKSEIVKLYEKNNSLIEEKKELLRRLKNLKNVEEYFKKNNSKIPFIEATVISKNFTGFTSSLIVNKGRKDGVKKNMPVMSEGSAVGKTYEVAQSYTKIILINDLRSSVDVILQENRHNGVIAGTGDPNSLALKLILKDFTVMPNERIITSGYGGIFPKGMLIGKIKSIKDDEYGLFKKITVTPFINFRKIENVVILLKEDKSLKFND